MADGPTDPRVNLNSFDYARELVDNLRRDVEKAIDHEKRYRTQYGQAAVEAQGALATNGWVTLKLEALCEDLADMKKAQSKIFATAFALLVSTLTLLVTVIFGILTRGAP